MFEQTPLHEQRAQLTGVFARTDAGTPDESGQVHRQKRTKLEIIKDLPLDWLLERNHMPALIMGWVMTLGAVAGAAIGFPLGTILAVNWGISQLPVASQFFRMMYKNHKNGVHNPLKWDWTWWTRPQSHQKDAVAVGPEVALELQIDAKNFVNSKPTWLSRHAPWVRDIPFIGVSLTRRHPWLARKIFLMECKLIVAADSPKKTVKRFFARQFDDLLNQRARTPSFVIGVGQLIAGEVIGLSTIVNFLMNAVVSWIPTGLSAFLAWQTGDMYRLSRPGIRQRPTEVARRFIAEQEGLKGHQVPQQSLQSPQLVPTAEISSPAGPMIPLLLGSKTVPLHEGSFIRRSHLPLRLRSAPHNRSRPAPRRDQRTPKSAGTESRTTPETASTSRFEHTL